MAEKKYTEHLGLTQQSEEDFVDGEEISRSFEVLDEEVFNIREKTDNLKSEDHYYSNDYYTFPEKVNDITYGNGRYVATGERNIYTSQDKHNWSIANGAYGASIAYGNGKYVAIVFRTAYYYLIASSDGESWSELEVKIDGTQITQGMEARGLKQIIYENGRFVAVGDGGEIYTSDGTGVTEISSPTTIDLKSVSFGNGIFLAVGYKSSFAVLLKSSDAVVWETISLPLELASNPYDKIVFGNGVFVIKDRRRVYVTTDGTDLTAYNTPEPPSGGDICFTDTKFFLSNGRSNFVSKNGIDWVDITKEFPGKITAIKYFNDEIIGITSENKLVGIKKYTVDGIRKEVAELNTAMTKAEQEISKKTNQTDFNSLSTKVTENTNRLKDYCIIREESTKITVNTNSSSGDRSYTMSSVPGYKMIAAVQITAGNRLIPVYNSYSNNTVIHYWVYNGTSTATFEIWFRCLYIRV